MNSVTGITGGIGSGKSMVCRILRSKGYAVYDCDYEAAMLMRRPEVVAKIGQIFGSEVVTDQCTLNRSQLAEIVFQSESARRMLESVVHPEVRKHLQSWLHRYSSQRRVFIECAILATSGIIDYCDNVWLVETPMETRIRRVALRNNLSKPEITRRIESQQLEFDTLKKTTKQIVALDNSGRESLLRQITTLIDECC